MAEGNNIDPTISLGFKTSAPINPLALSNSILPAVQTGAQIGNIQSEVQQRQIANAMQLRTILGQNAMAAIGAQSIDPTTGEPDLQKYAAGLLSNPLTAAQAPQIMSFARQAQQFQIESAQKQQEMVMKAMGGILTSVASAAGTGRLDQIAPLVNMQLNTQPDFIRTKLGPVVKYIEEGLTDGLPNDPSWSDAQRTQQQSAAVRQRLTQALAPYIPADKMDLITGKSENIDSGDAIHVGFRNPWNQQWSPSLDASGAPIIMNKGLAPSVTGQENIIQPGVHPAGNAAVGLGGTGNPFALPPPSGPTNRLNGALQGNPFGAGGITSAPSAATVQPAPTSWATGKPFVISPDPNVVPGRSTLGGQAQLRNPKLDLSDKLGADGEYTRTFQNAQVAMQQLQDLGFSADRLGAKGWLSPGFAANQRTTIAKMVNAFSQVTGADVGFDPMKVASAEDIQKNSYRLGISSLTQMLGAQREAAQTIERMFTATPGLENSPLGLQVLLSTVKASSQMAMDRYNFQSAWAAQNHALSASAETEFAKQSPPEAYAIRALADIGLNEHGWISPEALQAAVAKGWVTGGKGGQAGKMAQEQWGDRKNYQGASNAQ